MTPPQAIGVGFLGAGPVTQAIHLPALARLTGLFTVRVVADVSETTARAVAARVRARPTTSMEDLLQDASVEVVAVCSPHQFHAEQVIAACRARKKAVLCEKPFATTTGEASQIAEVSADTGVPVLVGAMHTFTEAWGPTRASAHHLRLSAVLPPNTRFEDFATEVSDRRPQAPSAPASVDDRANVLRGGILGLAIHDLPLVRAFLTATDDVVVHAARTLTPFGYLVVFSCDSQVVELHGHMSANWNPRWTLEAVADDRTGAIDFTPSYVQAGSATATIRSAGRSLTLGGTTANGYEGEWRHLHEVANGRPPLYPLEELVADLSFALAIADASAAAFLSEPQPAGVR
jgi:myo-inositol 2-dehydrogenase / D-chiro-inositol 1-dehydrogenase